MSETTPLDLLQRFHEHADKIENYVATDEVYWAEGGDYIFRARKWYWQSDLRKQTIAMIAAAPPPSSTAGEVG